MLRIVLDTGIIVSALIAGGNPRKILDEAMEGKVDIVISREILAEFLEVIARPKFARYLEKNDISKFIKELLKITGFVEVRSSFKAVEEDPTDDKVINAAYDSKAQYIVSGDKHLLKLKRYKNIRIITAKKMLDIIK